MEKSIKKFNEKILKMLMSGKGNILAEEKDGKVYTCTNGYTLHVISADDMYISLDKIKKSETLHELIEKIKQESQNPIEYTYKNKEIKFLGKKETICEFKTFSGDYVWYRKKMLDEFTSEKDYNSLALTCKDGKMPMLIINNYDHYGLVCPINPNFD